LIVERGVDLADPWAGVDAPRLERAVREQAGRPVAGAADMAAYLAAAVSDVSHREVVGPLLDGGVKFMIIPNGPCPPHHPPSPWHPSQRLMNR
jgi:hypothetical protein